MIYHSHYDENTYSKLGVCPTQADLVARQNMMRQLKFSMGGEVWVPGYGITPLWEGPELSKEDQNMLNIKECPLELMITNRVNPN